MIGFEAGGRSAAAEDREVMLAAVACPEEDRPTFGLTEPPHRVLRVTAMDDAADEPDHRGQHHNRAQGVHPPRRVRDRNPEAMHDVAEQGFRVEPRRSRCRR